MDVAKKKPEQAAGIGSQLKALSRKSTRMDAIAALGEAGAVKAVEPLLRLYKQSRKKEQAAICHALAQIGVPAIEPLIATGLGSKDSAVRQCAIRVIGTLGSEARPAIDPLLQCLDDKDDRVRIEAIDALGQIGGEGAVQALVGSLDAEDQEVRERAADALGALGEGAAERVGRVLEGEGSPRARFAAARALGQMGRPAAEVALCRAIEDPSAPPSLRVVILAALGETLGDRIVPLASAMLGSEDRGLRRQAVRCLRDAKTPESTTRLMALYEDKDKKVRRWAQSELLDRHEELLARIRGGEWEVLPVLWEAWQAVGGVFHDYVPGFRRDTVLLRDGSEIEGLIDAESVKVTLPLMEEQVQYPAIITDTAGRRHQLTELGIRRVQVGAFSKAGGLYSTYDFWIVFIAGFTPLPYKVITISAGVFGINFPVFLVASAVSRAARFFLVAGLIGICGEWIKPKIDRYFNLLCILFVILLVGGFALFKYL